MPANHRETYLWLLAPEQRAQVLQLLKEQGYQETIGYVTARVVDGPSWPYVLLRVPPSDRFVAHSGGVYLSLQAVLAEFSGLYYLPVVALVKPSEPIAPAHELTHVHDLLDLIERDPGYPSRAERMASYDDDDDADLEERIDYALAKNFGFEPQAFCQEYRSGLTSISMPFIGPIRVALPCLSEEGFVQTWLADYVGKLEEGWKSRFPALTERIVEAVRVSAERHGQAVFGEDVRERARQNREDVKPRFLQRVLRAPSAGG